MRLLAETYLVLDVPEPFATRVLELRRRAGDRFRSALPAEVTLVGSGGAGVIEPEQPLEDLLRSVRRVAASSAPIETALGEAHRFPGSDVFVFLFSPAEAIVELHTRLVATGLRSRPSPWPYVPHCTIQSRSPLLEGEADAVLRERVPGRFVLDSISIYTTNGLPALELVERVRLGRPEASLA